MKKLLLILLSTLSLQLSTKAVTYSITNDLSSAFTFYYWTNNAGSLVFSQTNTLPAGGGTNITVLTNGVAGLGVQSTNGTMFILVPWTNLPVINVFGSALFNDALVTIAPPVETVPQTQTILKSYYISGAHPKQANYWEWIDSMFYYINICATNAQLAAQAAQAATNTAHVQAMFSGQNGGATWFGPNISSVTAGSFVTSVTFSNAIVDTNYIVELGADTWTTNSAPVFKSKTVTGFQLDYLISTYYNGGTRPLSFTVIR